MRLFRFNLNDRIRVRLNDLGIAILAQGRVPHETSVDGVTSLQVWDFCRVFGDALYHGNPDLPLVDMDAEIEIR